MRLYYRKRGRNPMPRSGERQAAILWHPPAMRLRRLLPLSICLLPSLGFAETGSGPWQFDFGTNPPAAGHTQVTAATRFTAAQPYGFELAGKPDDLVDAITSSGGCHFSLEVPEGDYEITLTLGAKDRATDTTVKAECRRLMLEGIQVPAGKTRTEKFTVNVRRPLISGSDSVRLKDREKPYLHWDNKLTLEFNGPQPGIDSMQIRAVTVPVIYVIGDSTVTDQPNEPWNSWGQMLTRFLDAGVSVANYAESGESIKSSLSAKRIAKVERNLKKGDYVLVQFGHNDMKDKAPDALETYRKNLLTIAADVRKAGATPVLVTSMERKGGVEKDTLGGYPDAVRSVAKELKVPLIDLHAMSRVLYQALGPKLDLAFQDGTHHNNYGSYELARCVVEGLRKECPELASHIRPDAKPFNPAKPDKPEDFKVPASPNKDAAKPDGN